MLLAVDYFFMITAVGGAVMMDEVDIDIDSRFNLSRFVPRLIPFALRAVCNRSHHKKS